MSVERKAMFSIFRQMERSFSKHYLPGLHKNIIRLSFSLPCLWILWFNFSLFKKSQFFNRELTKCPVTFFHFLISFCFFTAVSWVRGEGRGINQSSPTEYKRGKDHREFIANWLLMSRDHRKKYRALWKNHVHLIVIQPKSSEPPYPFPPTPPFQGNK